MKYCCEPFERLVARVGKKGISVIASSENGRRFILQARPFENDVTQFFNEAEESSGKARWPEMLDRAGYPVPFVSIMQLPLRACPNCGKMLENVIFGDVEEFDLLAESMMG